MEIKQPRKYRIGIDARFYGPLGKGLGRYTQEIVDQITTLDTQNEYVIFLSKSNFDEFVPKNTSVTKVLADIPWYGFAEQIKMPRLIAKQNLDLMHFPHFNVPIFCPVPFVVTIHDLILTKFPTIRATTLGPVVYFIKNIAYRFGINVAVRRSQKIIAVSEYTKKDIIDQFGVQSEKVSMIYEGVANLDESIDQKFTTKLKASEILSGYCILEPYLLYVGNAYPHKNLESLIRVFVQLHKNQPFLKLVLVGREDYFYHRLKLFAQEVSNDNESIIFPGYVPDRDLQTLFEHADLYVFPSKYEGFGLPPLEAMSRGCAVASSNATCLPEILGEAAHYFDPNDEQAMYATIKTILFDPKLKQTLIAKGKERSKLFSWEQAARETLKVYQRSLKKNNADTSHV
jgi:glycosyltransferase involved in cell wall biosynthesis